MKFFLMLATISCIFFSTNTLAEEGFLNDETRIDLSSESRLNLSLRILTSSYCTDGEGAGGYYIDIDGIDQVADNRINFNWNVIVGSNLEGIGSVNFEADGTIVNFNCGSLSL